jgi:excisionase family DNA binding protein
VENFEIKNRLLTAKELANYLHYAEQTIYNKCSKNAKHPLPIKPIRIGRKLRFRLSDVEKYIESL